MRYLQPNVAPINRILASLAGLFLFAYMSMANAEIAGQADFVHGTVLAQQSASDQRTLQKGAEIFASDNIQTKSDGRVQLRFTDGGLISLMPNTNFSVEEYHLEDATDGSGSVVFNLLSGGLRTVTGAIGKKQHEDYELKTPVGTLGIRGTEFTANINPSGALDVHVGRGRVVLSNDWGSVDVLQGQSGSMSLGSAPTASDAESQGSSDASQSGAANSSSSSGSAQSGSDGNAAGGMDAGASLDGGLDGLDMDAMPDDIDNGAMPSLEPELELPLENALHDVQDLLPVDPGGNGCIESDCVGGGTHIDAVGGGGDDGM